MIIDLSGKRAIVTGSTSGIGFAIARGLADCGAAVVINGRSADSVKAAQQRLLEQVPGCSVHGIAADLAGADGVADFLRRAGEADILVNNLGIFEPAPFEAITDADWHRYFDTNVMSGIRLSRHYLPKMRERGWGRIVFISSESALNIPVEMIHYGVTKTAQLAVSRGLAESLAGTGHRELGSARPDAVGGRRGVLRQAGQGPGLVRAGDGGAVPSPRTGRPRCYAGSRRPRKSPTWSSMSARRRPRPRPAPRCGSMAGWCARLRNASARRCRGSDECRRAAPAGRTALQWLWFKG
jgi:NAD(P)-dependent dehydrogenase (short-subunit alcohol dehydrogenase family)